MRRFQELTVAVGWAVRTAESLKKSTKPMCKLHEESPVEPESARTGRSVLPEFGLLTENLLTLPPDHHLFHRGFDGQGRVVQLQGILCWLQWRNATGHVPCVARF